MRTSASYSARPLVNELTRDGEHALAVMLAHQWHGFALRHVLK